MSEPDSEREQREAESDARNILANMFDCPGTPTLSSALRILVPELLRARRDARERMAREVSADATQFAAELETLAINAPEPYAGRLRDIAERMRAKLEGGP